MGWDVGLSLDGIRAGMKASTSCRFQLSTLPFWLRTFWERVPVRGTNTRRLHFQANGLFYPETTVTGCANYSLSVADVFEVSCFIAGFSSVRNKGPTGTLVVKHGRLHGRH